MKDNQSSSYRWYILALVTFTGTFVVAITASCMPVLFDEISKDLDLDLIQIGTVWGMVTLAGVFFNIIGGVISDRFKIKMVLTVLCIMVGITGALRGLSDSFLTLTITVFLNGIARTITPVALSRTVGIWFKGPKLGVAMGLFTMGIGLGFLIGPLISATVLSPWLGGWRNVLYFYGLISVIFGVLWFTMGGEPPGNTGVDYSGGIIKIKQSFVKMVKLKVVWLLGLILLCRNGQIMSLVGYLPLYLREKHWVPAAADGALSVFYTASILVVIPLTTLSDRLGIRKVILLPALILSIFSTALIPVVPDSLIWVLMVLGGGFVDGFMALTVTMLMESKGVNIENAGVAVGIVFTMGLVGSVTAPPLGNSLAFFGAGVPFYFWAGLATLAFVLFLFFNETGGEKMKTRG
jgi:ACS family D-galactonate transporter-like MFS transporter